MKAHMKTLATMAILLAWAVLPGELRSAACKDECDEVVATINFAPMVRVCERFTLTHCDPGMPVASGSAVLTCQQTMVSFQIYTGSTCAEKCSQGDDFREAKPWTGGSNPLTLDKWSCEEPTGPMP